MSHSVSPTAESLLTFGPEKFRPSLLAEIRSYFGLFQGLGPQATRTLIVATACGFLEAWSISTFPQILSQRAQLSELGVFLLLSGMALFCGYLSDEWSWVLRTKLEAKIRLSLIDYFAKLPWSEACRIHSGRIHRTFTTEAYEIANGAYALIRAGAALFTLLGLFTVVAVFSLLWLMSLLLTAAVLMGVFIWFHRVSWTNLTQSTALLSGAIEKTADTWQCLKYSRSTEEFDFIRQTLSADVVQTSEIKQRYRVLYPRIAFAIRMVCLVALGGFLACAMQTQFFSGYDWIVPFALLYRLVPHVVHMHSLLHEAHTSYPWVLAYRSTQQVIGRTQPLIDGLKNPVRSPQFSQKLELHQLRFEFEPTKTLLQNLSLVIEKGSRVAITGASGSGKSTLIDLMTGLLSPTSGYLSLDTVAFEELDLRAWRKKLSVVSQETLLFQGTLQQNILWGQPLDASLLDGCLRKAALEDWVRTLPQGLHTPVSELGKTLSRGQQQRIAIARALYRQPEFIILDEPTTGLDASSCKVLFHWMESLASELTILVMTHDLRLLSRCHRAYELENGQLHPLPLSA